MGVGERGQVGDEGVGEGLAGDGGVGGESLEGLPGVIGVVDKDGLVEGGLEGDF